MIRNGKRWLAIGLAVMVGCMIPMGTMKASEEEQSVSQNSIFVETQQQDIPEAVQQQDVPVVGQTVQAADEPAQTEVSGVQFSYQQNDITGAFGDIVSSDIYIGMNGPHALTVNISNGSYCLLQGVSNVMQQDLEDRPDWKEIQGGQISLEDVSDGEYVACIKAVQNDNTIYAVSKSFVWDRTAPEIIDESGKEMINGGSYKADTKFTVTDLSPVDVYMNDDRSTPVQPVDGKYTVVPRANSTSCTIVARDKAGNEISLSLAIEGGGTAPEPEEPITITESKTYTLHEGTAYILGAGSWKVEEDSSDSVYPGGITFYVPSGSYTFQRQ